MDNITIRVGIPSDADSICALAAELSAHEGVAAPMFTPLDFKRFGFGKEQRFHSIVAESDTKIVGYLFFCDSFHVGMGSPGLNMLDLFVEKKFRQKGIGKKLMQALSTECNRRHGNWITWQCQPANETALRFYQNVGGRRYTAIDFELAGTALQRLLGSC